MNVKILNFGCRLNAYEAQVMKDNATAAGISNAIMVNTCAVTKEAERQARQAIRKAKRNNPNMKIIVSGCSAQISPEIYSNMPEVDKVIGNQEKLNIAQYHQLKQELAHNSTAANNKVNVADIMNSNSNQQIFTENTSLTNNIDRYQRALLQVQTGCNHRCTFCVIPFGRGNSRSVPIEHIISQAKQFVANGHKELVITGVDISDYGKDLPAKPSLGYMLKQLLAEIPDIPRIRISSIDISEIDNELFHLFATENRIMPHLHLSLQSGDDMILKRMKRRHSRADIINFSQKIRAIRPDIVLGADIIAGFPTETETMFNNTLQLIEEVNITYLHVFPYSQRPNTPAARMPQLPVSLRKERADKLRQLGNKQLESFLKSRIGKRANILIENNNKGHCQYFTPVYIQKNNIADGTIITATITAMTNNHLIAEVTT